MTYQETIDYLFSQLPSYERQGAGGYNPGLQTTVYIAEYDANGKATGRYGKTTITMPDYEDDMDSYKAPQPARKLHVRVRK